MAETKAKRTAKWENSKLAEQIENRLKEIGKTKEDLAEKLKIKASAVRQWTNGYARPDIDKIVDIAHFLDVSTDFLFGLSDYRNKALEEMAVSEVGLSESAAKKIKKLGIAGSTLNETHRNEESIRKQKLHILNSFIEHNDFEKFLSQIELYVMFANIPEQDDEKIDTSELFHATEIIKKAGKNVSDNKTVAETRFLYALKHIQHIIEDIPPYTEHTEQDEYEEFE